MDDSSFLPPNFDVIQPGDPNERRVSRRYYPGEVDPAEDLEKYIPGGYHPIFIGDEFKNGRYKIVHKLGYGGFSTVWAARDQHVQPSILVALKAMTASQSSQPIDELPDLIMPRKLYEAFPDSRRDFQMVEDHFLVEGPNGSHRFIITALAGPSVLSLSLCPGRLVGSRRLRGDLARSVAKQMATALQRMHQIDMVHGDFTTSNVLFRMKDEVREWSDAELYHNTESPRTAPVRMIDEGQPLCPEAPKELVATMDDYFLVFDSFLHEAVSIIDFGQSYIITEPPVDYSPGTLRGYAPPEMRFENRSGPEADVWMLACAIFEIRSGCPLFSSFFGDDSEILMNIVDTVGKLPEPWRDAFEARTKSFQEGGPAKRVEKSPDIRSRLEMIGTSDQKPRDMEGDMIEKIGVRLQTAEIDLLADLLVKMLRPRPEERLSIQEVVIHAWFKYCDAR